ncbi:hypothetical protein SAY86_020914 [Trapa natans]|uniref:F-box domain-containing protein n=1 Tax=Trapa natans TaxID=22666 RepID=A0AAN7M8Y6_TRANT|nr:hypothetical protein SAY86_020914 [Trapa natans]
MRANFLINVLAAMETLPDVIVQYILSYMNNARDLAICNCVSRQWKESTRYIRSLYFPRNSFDKLDNPDNVVLRMISSLARLEELVVYCPFSCSGLASWLSVTALSLRHLELRMDNLTEHSPAFDGPTKMDIVGVAKNLESMKLWGVLMIQPPKWDMFHQLKRLEIVGARLEDQALSFALQACPNLVNLLLLGCEGVRSLSIELPCLEECKLDFYGLGNCSLALSSPRIRLLEVQGCSWIQVRGTSYLHSLTISNNSGRVDVVDFGNLPALEFLSIRGVQWCWDAISKMLKWANQVKHLFMKVEFTGDFEALQPFPEVDFVDFFNSHPKLIKFDAHGAMFAALCQKNSLKNVDADFTIPCLEEVVLTARSPLNAEQKMNTLESLLRYGKNLKTLVIKILQMNSNHNSADDFFQEICRFRYFNRNIVRIE